MRHMDSGMIQFSRAKYPVSSATRTTYVISVSRLSTYVCRHQMLLYILIVIDIVINYNVDGVLKFSTAISYQVGFELCFHMVANKFCLTKWFPKVDFTSPIVTGHRYTSALPPIAGPYCDQMI